MKKRNSAIRQTLVHGHEGMKPCGCNYLHYVLTNLRRYVLFVGIYILYTINIQ
jgi:hypothetical protein